MVLLQILMSVLFCCILGFPHPVPLALTIIGALIPNIDNTNRYYGHNTVSKGFTHSLLFVALFFIAAWFCPPVFFLGIGVLGHIIVELFSYEAKLQLLWPLPLRIHIPLVKQYKKIVFVLIILVSILLFFFFVNFDLMIDIMMVYLSWLKLIISWIVDKLFYIFERVSYLF